LPSFANKIVKAPLSLPYFVPLVYQYLLVKITLIAVGWTHRSGKDEECY
jgi:hypothetical protein